MVMTPCSTTCVCVCVCVGRLPTHTNPHTHTHTNTLTCMELAEAQAPPAPCTPGGDVIRHRWHRSQLAHMRLIGGLFSRNTCGMCHHVWCRVAGAAQRSAARKNTEQAEGSVSQAEGSGTDRR